MGLAGMSRSALTDYIHTGIPANPDRS
jgi:hypothetical protein